MASFFFLIPLLPRRKSSCWQIPIIRNSGRVSTPTKLKSSSSSSLFPSSFSSTQIKLAYVQGIYMLLNLLFHWPHFGLLLFQSQSEENWPISHTIYVRYIRYNSFLGVCVTSINSQRVANYQKSLMKKVRKSFESFARIVMKTIETIFMVF